jgi:Uma2 family endonuclease
MAVTQTRKLMTAEELLKLPDNGTRRELIKGEIREMAPAGAKHGRAAMKLASRLDRYAEEHDLGIVLAAETGFRLSREPDTVRAPDLSFVAKGRIPPEGPPDSYWDLAPDLVTEVVSPNDTADYVQEKAQTWLEAGVRLMWVVYPNTRSVVVYESLKEIRVLTPDDRLEGGDVVPGFRCPVAEVFG